MSFSEDRAQGKFGPYHLIIADNPYVLWDAAEHWRAAWKEAGGGGPRIRTFAAPQADFEELLGAGATVPMFETIQPVIVRDVEKFTGMKQEEFLRILRQSSQSTKWLLTCGSIDKRTTYYKSLSQFGPVEVFPKIYPEHIPGWVQRIASDLGVSLAPAATELLATVHGADLFGVRQTIERADLYLGHKRRFEVADLEVVMAGEGEYDVFQLLEAGSRKDFHRALAIARSLSAGAKPRDVLPFWLALIYGQCVRYIQLLGHEGKSDAQIGQIFHLHPFVISRLRTQATGFGPERLVAAIEAVFETDRMTKTSTVSPEIAWELLVWRISSGRSQQPLFDLEQTRTRE